MASFLEKLDGSCAKIEHPFQCTDVLSRLHRLGVLHGNINRYSLIAGKAWTRLIEFETCQETRDRRRMRRRVSHG